jgi:hypothetical protein
MYTVWNLWKERAMTESELQSLIELDVSQWRAAWSPPRRCFLSTLLFFSYSSFMKKKRSGETMKKRGAGLPFVCEEPKYVPTTTFREKEVSIGVNQCLL